MTGMAEHSAVRRAVVGTAAVASGILLYLRFGDVQSFRWVYMFQCYVSPASRDPLRPPARYTGTWRTWHSNGKLATEHHYVDGVMAGEYRLCRRSGVPDTEGVHDWSDEAGRRVWQERYYWPSGRKSKEIQVWNRKRDGILMEWHRNGQLAERGTIEKGLKHGEWTYWLHDGGLLGKGVWQQGVRWSGTFREWKRAWVVTRYSNGNLVSTSPVPLWSEAPVDGGGGEQRSVTERPRQRQRPHE